MTEMTQAQQDAFLQEVALEAQARRDDYRLVIRGQEYSTFDLARMTASGETALFPPDVQASIDLFMRSMSKTGSARTFIAYGQPDDENWPIEITGGSGDALKCYVGCSPDQFDD